MDGIIISGLMECMAPTRPEALAFPRKIIIHGSYSLIICIAVRQVLEFSMAI